MSGQQGVVHYLNLPVPLRMIGAGARLGNARQFLQFTVNMGWESKSWYKIIVDLIKGWVGLCKSCEVIYYQQNVLKSLLTFLQMEEVYGHHLK